MAVEFHKAFHNRKRCALCVAHTLVCLHQCFHILPSTPPLHPPASLKSLHLSSNKCKLTKRSIRLNRSSKSANNRFLGLQGPEAGVAGLASVPNARQPMYATNAAVCRVWGISASPCSPASLSFFNSKLKQQYFIMASGTGSRWTVMASIFLTRAPRERMVSRAQPLAADQ